MAAAALPHLRLCPAPRSGEDWAGRAAALADLPAPADWPRAGRAMPAAKWVTHLRRAGWPVAVVTVSLPKSGGVGRGTRSDQPVAVVPEAWLRALAARLGVRWADACRGRVADG